MSYNLIYLNMDFAFSAMRNNPLTFAQKRANF